MHGTGEPTLVYLHGLLLDSQLNRGLAESLARLGVRVALLDLLGHGRSEKPLKASAYRMDSYADEVVAFLDHLGVERAVIGGVSLGADVSLQVVVRAPERVAGLVLEMPVLERAVPPAALLFTPLLLAMHYASGPAGFGARLARRLPRTGVGSIDSVLDMLSTPPEVTKAVLHGILTGPVAPTVEERRAIAVPMLVIAHSSDVIHPFSDAERARRDGAARPAAARPVDLRSEGHPEPAHRRDRRVPPRIGPLPRRRCRGRIAESLADVRPQCIGTRDVFASEDAR